ncbi:hypothetical protein LPJ56_002986 [Coemansia sp. RSA 2599]|nr:hypothetical protein LPJ75_001720 [Coemansia sp. RSA 2598]KAJ1823421.1 hypothetical protein LPJ56_002986 [Coemansia sp. RSA 2599]
MRFRTLTGAQRHRVTNMLFFAGVASAIGTVTGTSLLGCPAVSRESKLDGEEQDQAMDACVADTAISAVSRPKGLRQKQFVGGKIESVATDDVESCK